MAHRNLIHAATVLAVVVLVPQAQAGTVLDDFASNSLAGYTEVVLRGEDLVEFVYDPDGEKIDALVDDALDRNVFLGVAVLDDSLTTGVISGGRYRQALDGSLHVDWVAYSLVDGALEGIHEELDVDDPAPGHDNSCDIGPKVVSYHLCTCDWVTVPLDQRLLPLPSPGRMAFVAGGNDAESLVLLLADDPRYLEFEKLLGDFHYASGQVGLGFVGGLDDLRLAHEADGLD